MVGVSPCGVVPVVPLGWDQSPAGGKGDDPRPDDDDSIRSLPEQSYLSFPSLSVYRLAKDHRLTAAFSSSGLKASSSGVHTAHIRSLHLSFPSRSTTLPLPLFPSSSPSDMLDILLCTGRGAHVDDYANPYGLSSGPGSKRSFGGSTKRKVSKIQIGSPTDFRHESHMGYDDVSTNWGAPSTSEPFWLSNASPVSPQSPFTSTDHSLPQLAGSQLGHEPVPTRVQIAHGKRTSPSYRIGQSTVADPSLTARPWRTTPTPPFPSSDGRDPNPTHHHHQRHHQLLPIQSSPPQGSPHLSVLPTSLANHAPILHRLLLQPEPQQPPSRVHQLPQVLLRVPKGRRPNESIPDEPKAPRGSRATPSPVLR